MNYSAQFARRPFPPLRRRSPSGVLQEMPPDTNSPGWSARAGVNGYPAVHVGTRQALVLAWLTGREPIRTHVIAQRMGLDRRSVDSAVQALFRKGAVRRFGDGVYGVVDDESR